MSSSGRDDIPANAADFIDDRAIIDAALLAVGRHPDPFGALGRRDQDGQSIIRAFWPGAQQCRLVDGGQTLRRLGETDLFEWRGSINSLTRYYRLSWIDADGCEFTGYDPYAFSPQLTTYDLHLFNEGRHLHAYRMLGAHLRLVDGIVGVLFSVWAPNAERVSVVGDFNAWNGLCHPLRRRGDVWELFVPELPVGTRYQFEILNRETALLSRKSDPYGRSFEQRPAVCSLVAENTAYSWGDQGWMAWRRNQHWSRMPLSVYEVHLGSWQRDEVGNSLSYPDLARRLVAYVTSLGFTHIELMPVTEHPLDDSWGYQTTGYFSPTSRYGSANDLRWFIDYCHQAGIGVLLDWVPGHFPKDSHGLACFDGHYLYEYADPSRREHRSWGTLVFDYSCTQVRNFLLASACFWLEEFHLDGLRVDAVASMLYLDYARESDEWNPNLFGGNENLEAVGFLRELNDIVHRRYPGVLMVAEESTAWPLVTQPSWLGGLGFDLKWNMGWMHDTLEYFALDPALRRCHQELLTFGLLYAFNEKFMLPLSHDEVVHAKGSLLEKMPGDRQQRFANLRLLYFYLWTYPGKKFFFMGNELAQEREWDFSRILDWELLDRLEHRSIQRLIRDLNALYRSCISLHDYDFSQEGFEWVDCCDSAQSVIVYLRRSANRQIALVAINFAATAQNAYRIGVPQPGPYHEVLNSDAIAYGGSGRRNDAICALPVFHRGQSYSLVVSLPPLTGIVLVPDQIDFTDE